VAQRFNVQSAIAMALYPKAEKPYLVGLHQCSYPRVWTAQEERLFQEIGRRLEDALTGLLMLHNLRESERKLEEAQRLTHVGYWELDPNTDLITWSDETYRICGLPPQERTITFAGLQELIHPEDRQIIVQAVAEALRSGSRYDVEYRVVRPDGEVRVVHARGDIMRDESGRPCRMFGTAQDITERKRAEEALHEAQADLTRVTRVATLGELTASIAHEINQPLGAVVNSASACLRWLDAHKVEEARRSAARVIAEGHRASEIISRIRTLVKKAPPRKDWLNVNEAIQEVLALAHSEVQRNGIVLGLHLAEAVPLILADRIQVQQVLLNLLMNAIEAMSDRGEGPRELVIRSDPEGSQGVLVAVQDSGPGLDPQSVDRLFDAFYTTKSHGLGMGLAISRSIIEAHGGRLWATANVPRGVVFQFTLPIGGEGVA
jgi:PAS domain S-box-containing protein